MAANLKILALTVAGALILATSLPAGAARRHDDAICPTGQTEDLITALCVGPNYSPTLYFNLGHGDWVDDSNMHWHHRRSDSWRWKH